MLLSIVENMKTLVLFVYMFKNSYYVYSEALMVQVID
jgi:hypothetical protein